jgi:hypothetical protein
VFKGDEAVSDGEMPIRKTLAPVKFALDLKEQLEKIEPARILKNSQSPRTGRLVRDHFTLISISPRSCTSESPMSRHSRLRIRDRRGSREQGRHGTIRSNLGRATHFDMVNAAERIYITLSANPYRYDESGNISLPE